jgi:hypothetical protein
MKSGKVLIKSVGNFIKNNLAAAVERFLILDSSQYAQATIGASQSVTKGDGTDLYGTIPAWSASNWEIEFDVIFPTAYGTTPLGTWTQGATPADNTWVAVAWSPTLGLFAAVAEGSTGLTDRVMTSPDGVTWTLRTTKQRNWRAICWVAQLGLFVAVANAGTGTLAMTSDDGITWTPRTTPADNAWRSVVWADSLNLLVAISDTGTTSRVMTSPNGIDWTLRTSPAASAWQSVAWSEELDLLVAVANAGTNRVMTSPDAINWTERSASAANSWAWVTWSKELGLFFSVASAGTGRGMRSTNGIDWTTTTPGLDTAFRSIIWAAELGLFITVAAVNSGSNILTSINGTNWTQYSIGPTLNQWRGLCWSPELGILVATANTSAGAGIGNRAMVCGSQKTLLSGPTSANKFNVAHNIFNGKLYTIAPGTSTMQLDGVTLTNNVTAHPLDGWKHHMKLASSSSSITIDRILHMTRSTFQGAATMFNLSLKNLTTPANDRFYPLDETIATDTFADTLDGQDGTWLNRVAGDVLTVFPDVVLPTTAFTVACKFRVPSALATQFLMSIGSYVSGGSSLVLRLDAAGKLVATRVNNTTGVNNATFTALSPDTDYIAVVTVAVDGSMTLYVNDIGSTATAAAGTAFTYPLGWINLNGAKSTDGNSSTRGAVDFSFAYLWEGILSAGDITSILAGADPTSVLQGYELEDNYNELNGGVALTPYGSPTFGP